MLILSLSIQKSVGAPDKLDDLAYAMVKFCVRMAQNVTEAELERARNKLKATTLMVLDSTHAVCEGMAVVVCCGRFCVQAYTRSQSMAQKPWRYGIM